MEVGTHHSELTKIKCRDSKLRAMEKGWIPSTAEMVKNRKEYYSSGGKSPMFGRRQSQLAIETARKRWSGEKHPMWKGGIDKDLIYRNKRQNEYRRRRGKHYIQERNDRRRKYMVVAGILTKDVIQKVYEDNIVKYGTLTCSLCCLPIEFGEDSLEHIIPISKGGSNDYNNLSVAHRRCNSRKGARL